MNLVYIYMYIYSERAGVKTDSNISLYFFIVLNSFRREVIVRKNSFCEENIFRKIFKMILKELICYKKAIENESIT